MAHPKRWRRFEEVPAEVRDRLEELDWTLRRLARHRAVDPETHQASLNGLR